MELHSEYNEYRISVPQEFENVFTHFYFAENSSEFSITKTLLPTYQTILLFCFGESATMSTREKTVIQIDKCMVFGPVRQAFEYTLPSGSSILVANFKDDAFFRFFGKISIEQPARHPDELLEENCFTDLWHQLISLHSTSGQVNHILEFCRPYLQHRDPTSQLLGSFENDLLNPIKVIAEQTQQTERNIQRKQKEQFGYSLKELNRYNRFLKAIKIIEKETEAQNPVKWFTIIDECGYYDQSQLIHDFRHFINISPAQYLKFQQEICNPRS
ncbi:AraC-like DNA-binding protein [Chryseobacterium bernardetii]|uniref:AraC-like DNA-binding protein n=2 Tax=Chryseobacterium TaxID=59732 RepID=A0A543EMW3_9FLAO|nr:MULTISPECIES: helix-turn-helix domain-containing protein [Chryseobacterium]MDR6369323.1 AraC-like DNA-binding protein [Chryseobacterium vietnamense]MDR6439755.1 AraC-like DNA-binding protein [Chryseobacterium bernardetii]TQM22923.1 AraC-like DNA-binding protein [Chryseobacterium aquifrigidense]